MWETALAKIEAGGMDANTFRKGIEVYAGQITAELLSVHLSIAGEETCPCPKCGNGRILFYPKVAKCSNVDCTLTIFRSKCDKQLTDKQIVELVTKRKTGLIKGFKGKNGKTFDASLVLDGQKGNRKNNPVLPMAIQRFAPGKQAGRIFYPSNK